MIQGRTENPCLIPQTNPQDKRIIGICDTDPNQLFHWEAWDWMQEKWYPVFVLFCIAEWLDKFNFPDKNREIHFG